MTIHHNIKIDMDLLFTSKWHAGSGEGSLLIDRLIRRDTRNWPFIPGSTLKGMVRESCERLSRTLNFPEPSDPHQVDLTIQDGFHPLDDLESPVDRIFGNRYQTGNLFFRDTRLEDCPAYGYLNDQNRISMCRALGTARDHHLFSSEYVAPMNFKTIINGYHTNLVRLDEADPPFEYCLLIAGIMNLDRLCGDKSTGSGNLQITFNSIMYNDRLLKEETIFDYLDPELYSMTKEVA